jgi:hypothetical protein
MAKATENIILGLVKDYEDYLGYLSLKDLIKIQKVCRSAYFTDEDTIWEPFEDYDKEQVLEFVMNNFLSLCDFIEIEHKQSDVLKLKI